jgi:hypothetical protein
MILEFPPGSRLFNKIPRRGWSNHLYLKLSSRSLGKSPPLAKPGQKWRHPKILTPMIRFRRASLYRDRRGGCRSMGLAISMPKKGSGANGSPPKFRFVWTIPLRAVPPAARRSRPRGASFRERARPLRKQPKLPPVPWRQPLPFPARGARCGSTPCRCRQG